MLDRPAPSAVTVLVEGPSDVAAVTALAGRRRVDLEASGVTIVSMGGVTNIGRYLSRTRRAHRLMPIAGLCDIGEVQFVQRALRREGLPGNSFAEMARHGFFVCDRDLEDELLRALGVDGAQQVLRDEGELITFRRFQHQPAQRDRPVHDQLHRFIGTRSGRKVRLAESMTLALDDEHIPPPLAGLLDFVTWASREDSLSSDRAGAPGMPEVRGPRLH